MHLTKARVPKKQSGQASNVCPECQEITKLTTFAALIIFTIYNQPGTKFPHLTRTKYHQVTHQFSQKEKNDNIIGRWQTFLIVRTVPS